MNNQPTPGPWQYSGPIVEGSLPTAIMDSEGHQLAHVLVHEWVMSGHPITADEADANAHLIAAAPDLLAVCRAMLAERTRDDHTSRIALIAIAKAEGRDV